MSPGTDITVRWPERLKQRFSQRPDSEHGQALVRLAVLSVVLVYLLLHGPGDGGVAEYRSVLAMVGIGFVVGVGIVLGIALRPGVSHLMDVVHSWEAERHKKTTLQLLWGRVVQCVK